MADLWDAEFREVDRIRLASGLAAVTSAAFAGEEGWSWWACVAVFICAGFVGVLAENLIGKKYDRIRLEMDFRRDEELWGLGWDTKEEAKADLASKPLHIQRTHCVMRYFNGLGRERWGICNKPKYWRSGEMQARDEAKAQNRKPTKDQLASK